MRMQMPCFTGLALWGTGKVNEAEVLTCTGQHCLLAGVKFVQIRTLNEAGSSKFSRLIGLLPRLCARIVVSS